MSAAAYKVNIEKVAGKNKFYRRVLHTTKQTQLVVMSIGVGDRIPLERHPGTTQFIRVEKGRARVTVSGKKQILGNGDSIMIPAGATHEVLNYGKIPLKLYTLYSPPHHKPGALEKKK